MVPGETTDANGVASTVNHSIRVGRVGTLERQRGGVALPIPASMVRARISALEIMIAIVSRKSAK
jgi:hypothetical protein